MMQNNDEHAELSAEERRLFAALPRERDPGRLLEERTIRTLRANGLLQPAGWRSRVTRTGMGAISAAAVAVFLVGVVTGQQLAVGGTPDPSAVASRGTAGEVALLVQQTGSAYVAAMAELADLNADTAGGPAAQGREVAAGTLHAAADELLRIAPDDVVASAILAGAVRRVAQPVTHPDSAAARVVVWF